MARAFYYSLRRRFFNKHSLILMLVITLISSFLFFFDHLSDRFFEEDIELSIQSETLYPELIQNHPFLKMKDQANIKIEYEDAKYSVHSKNVLSQQEKEVILESLDIYQRSLYPYLDFEVEFQSQKKGSPDYYAPLNTFLYFFMMNFSAMMVHEVIAEKENNLLEYLSTIVAPQKIFRGKLIMGVFSVIFQLFLYCLIFLGLLFIRNQYDGGKALLKLLYQWGVFTKDYAHFSELFSAHTFQIKHLLVLFFYLLSTLYLIQMFMLSSTVSSQNIEEASMIQGPFYLCLLFLYYFCMALESKNSSYLSFFAYCPLFSSLLAPKMIFEAHWGFWEILFSISSHCLILYYIRKFCEKRYIRGMFLKK